MALQGAPRNFVTWDSGSFLVPPTPPDVWPTIPANALKVVPKFTGEDFKTPSEHLREIENVCRIHNITS